MVPAPAGLVPMREMVCGGGMLCSPRVRGWSRPAGLIDVPPVVVPAHAGLVPVDRGHGGW
ncbi:hypothetical protein CP981_06350 [Streptomyces platensis]|uniref:Uncharacterized protein n=1 Tax=Streptomyces platensis TaxID=58346 RepID=A0AAE6NGB0_STRPT|nr:hypothetical protein CP981_06350 [Streptomyces platensis]